jgi:hypothetical protein
VRRGDNPGRRRRRNLLQDFLIGGLQLYDLICHLTLTGGELLDGLAYGGKLLFDSLS